RTSPVVEAHVRQYVREDLESIVALSLRAWAPVFASLEEALGSALFTRLRGDWRQGQSTAVRQVLNDEAMRAWVAHIDDRVAGSWPRRAASHYRRECARAATVGGS
ncbi:MAG: hypothetical protein ACR2MK_05395, partial [Solirubrobacteraceae bacterium]